MDPIVAFALICFLLTIVLLTLWLRARGRNNRAEKRISEAEATVKTLKEKFAPITSVEDEIATLSSRATQIQQKIEEAQNSYAEKHATLRKLEQQVAIYSEKLSFAELGHL